MISQYGALEDFPAKALDGGRRERALLFKKLATLRTDAPLFSEVDELRWKGPAPAFAVWAERIGDAKLLPRAQKFGA
jgi:hypothetical protein